MSFLLAACAFGVGCLALLALDGAMTAWEHGRQLGPGWARRARQLRGA